MTSTHAFSSETSQALGGPDWLAGRRRTAFDRWSASVAPTSAEEVWRYSRIDQFDLARWHPAGARAAATGVPPPLASLLDEMGERAALVVSVNGRVVEHSLDDSLAAKGVEVCDLTELSGDARDLVGRASAGSADWFVDLHDAFLAGGAFIRIPAGVVVDRPILVFDLIDGEPGSAAFPHTLVVAEESSEATVLGYRSAAAADALSSAVIELVVGDGATLRFLGVQNHAPSTWEVALQRATVGRDARLTSSAIALGGSYARLRSESLLEGTGGESDMLAVYFGDGTQMLDFRTLQDHTAPRTRSDLLFKGAVEHEAHSVYSGLVRLREGAQKAVAHQTNRTLKLSPRSFAESVPNLEIEANDVICTHASAIGPVDEEQLYYLESRGVRPEVAERLVVSGFFEDVFDRLDLTTLAAALRGEVAGKFARRDRRG